MASGGDHDALGEALHFLRMSGLAYCSSALSAPWGLALPPLKGSVRLHVVTTGRAILQGPGIKARAIETGEMVLIPHGEGHSLVDNPASPAIQIESLPLYRVGERYDVLRHGGGGPGTDLICVTVRFDNPAAGQLISLLPRVIHVKAHRSHELEWLDPTLRFVASETRDFRPGGETVVTRLADILVIQTIRWWVEHDPQAQVGWLRALRDRQIGRAIVHMHRDLARQWTVTSLGAEVAMSRSAFAARFTDLVGEPAMRYLTRWRMYAALTSLKHENVDLGDLANRFGYESEAAFSRAFRRFIGTPPGAVRRSSAESPERLLGLEGHEAVMRPHTTVAAATRLRNRRREKTQEIRSRPRSRSVAS